MHPELIGVIVALSLIVSILLVMLGICILKRRRARRRWGPPRSQILFDPEADLPPERGMKGRMEDSGLETQDVIPAPFVVEVYPQPEPTAGPSTGGPSPMARRDVRMPVDKKLATEFSATRVVTNRQSEDFNPPPRYTVVYGQRSSDVAGLASPPLPPLPSPSFSLQ
ncbi:hypothetical protein FB45DRAFT_939008 [Roridomyces roridus]|uniref:Uncharacterized protein n=1 Tax=Roridomyces roridus TaxID=1738132 RepID=A0AAD7B7Q8_9AGAR|nr:hypothetical protein FB45DRAFT_939008 [Roridomyces roridus]